MEDTNNGDNSEIFFRVSDDNGQTFAPFTDLSNNDGFSAGQQMIVSGKNVYVVWEDNSDNAGNSDIFFRVSDDNGQTFAPFKNLSNNTGFTFKQMIVSGNNVYVVWEGASNDSDLDIFFTVSNDNGQTFAFTDLSNNAGDSDSQEMIVSGNNVYVVWEDNSGNAGNSDIFFRVSDDNGQTFAPFKNLSNNAGASFNSHMIVQ